jgi:hypothetical protein
MLALFTVSYTKSHYVYLILIMVHFAYARSHSRGARVRDPTEQVHEVLVLHKRQVAWVLILFVSKASPSASHHLS